MTSLKDKLETRREQILEEQKTTPKKHKLYYVGMNHENLNCKEDVKEAVLELSNFTVVQIPARVKCDSCKNVFELVLRRNTYVKGDYYYCYTCFNKKIFGELEK